MKGDSPRDIMPEKDLSELSPPKLTHQPLTISVLRHMEVTDRRSTVTRSFEADGGDLTLRDPLVSTFFTLGGLVVSSTVSFGHQSGLAMTVATHARDNNSEMVIMLRLCR